MTEDRLADIKAELAKGAGVLHVFAAEWLISELEVARARVAELELEALMKVLPLELPGDDGPQTQELPFNDGCGCR